MFSHVTLGSSDIERTRTFYNAVLGTLGVPAAGTDAKGRLIYGHDGGRLVITLPVNGQDPTGANGGTLGFVAKDSAAVDAWHAAGIANGGTTCEDPPGERAGGMYYLAYLRDPDGNKLCGLHRIAKKA